MKNVFERSTSLSDSIYISSNLNFNNLSPLSTYLGKPEAKILVELILIFIKERQKQHREAEILSVMDTNKFIENQIIFMLTRTTYVILQDQFVKWLIQKIQMTHY